VVRPAALVVLAKHARPEVDPRAPASSWVLGRTGFEGAERLALRLELINPALVVTSVEPKARDTGRIVAAALDLPFQTGHDLHEHVRRGYLERDQFSASVRQLFAEPQRVVFGEESADAAAARFTRALDAVIKAHAGKRLIVVAHGTVISLYLERRYRADGWAMWQALETPSYVIVDPKAKSIVEVVTTV
jgi:broad specificity phosphatase PhoE